MAEESSLSPDEIDALLGDGPSDEGGGGDADDLNLDSLLGDDASAGSDASAGLDEESLNAIAGAMGAPPASAGGGGGSGSFSAGDSMDFVAPAENRDNAELLLDVNLRLSVELGRTHMYIKDVLMLGEGSIVELDKNVGDEVDILVNDRLFGRGKLVVVGEYFAVQVTQVFDPLARFRSAAT